VHVDSYDLVGPTLFDAQHRVERIELGDRARREGAIERLVLVLSVRSIAECPAPAVLRKRPQPVLPTSALSPVLGWRSRMASRSAALFAAFWRLSQRRCRSVRGISRDAPDQCARPVVDDLIDFFDAALRRLCRKSVLAGAVRYAGSRREAPTRHLDDGRLETSNNAAERAVRQLALRPKKYLFAGSDVGAGRAAAIYPTSKECSDD
jgi:hypothetical protein